MEWSRTTALPPKSFGSAWNNAKDARTFNNIGPEAPTDQTLHCQMNSFDIHTEALHKI